MEKYFEENLVSIIIPVFNSEKFISESLESALNQTYKEIEVIIVDDCSQDNSYKVIKNYLEQDSRVKYYKLDKNSGAAVARNYALKYSRGRYVAFLDSDDVWIKDKIEKQMKLLKKMQGAISYTAIEMIDENGVIVKDRRNVREVVDYNYILKNTMIACSSVIIDRKITGDFKMPLIKAGQDYATWLLLMRDGKKAYGLNEVLVRYRRVQGSISSNKWKSLKKVWNIYTKFENINPIRASYYSMYFTINALKKYFT